MAGSDLLLPKSEEGQAGDISEYSDASRFPGLLLPANGVWERKWPEILAKKRKRKIGKRKANMPGMNFTVWAPMQEKSLLFLLGAEYVRASARP